MNENLKRIIIVISLIVLILGLIISVYINKTFNKLKTPQDNSEDIEKDLLKGTTYINNEGKTIIKDPNDILVLVNKERYLPEDYIPSDLVIPDIKFSFEEDIPKKYLRKEAAKHLEDLFEDAKDDGINLFGVSGYRSYSRQESIFNNKVESSSLEEAKKLVANPGQSEHQTGLAIDVSSHEMNFLLEEKFEDTDEGQWIKENSHKYGFIIRYPKDKIHITKYSYEPWHIRFVGIDAATEMYNNDLTLEEFLNFK